MHCVEREDSRGHDLSTAINDLDNLQHIWHTCEARSKTTDGTKIIQTRMMAPGKICAIEQQQKRSPIIASTIK